MTRLDRSLVDAIHPPMPRRQRPLVIRWDWILGAVLVLAVSALFYGAALIRWGLS
jgi:hypothetical protein